MPHPHATTAAAIAIAAACAAHANAQSTCISYGDIFLFATADADADDPNGNPDPPADECEARFERNTQGVFDDTLVCSAASGAFSADATNNFRVDIGDCGITLDATLDASNAPPQGADNDASASATVGLTASIVATTDTTIALGASLQSDNPLDSAPGLPPTINLDIVDPTFQNPPVFLEFNATTDGNEVFEVIEVAAGSSIIFNVALGISSCNGDLANPDCSTYAAEISASLLLCDEDQDGLLDCWETDGIDTNADGTPEIDLPALGADPRRKDLFVEVDVQQGDSLAQAALDEVAQSFANAPVDNPDGSTGITLHADIDETNLPPRIYTEADAFAVIADQREANFGTAAQRNAPNAEDILKAKSLAYRYGVYGGTVALTDPDTMMIRNPSGLAELPGDDFIVTLDPLIFTVREGDAARTFMHELGHTLGLRHGGADDIRFKPNYFSVMNYQFQLRRPAWGDDWNNAIELDYSRAALPPVLEDDLNETTPISNDPSTTGRLFAFFNPAPAGSLPGPVFIEDAGPADLPDWNADGDTNDTGVVADANNLDNDSDFPETLNGHNDWANIRLPLIGSANFGQGVGAGETTLDSGEITAQLQQNLNAITPTSLADTTTPACPGDTDNNNTIDLNDLLTVLSNFANAVPGGPADGDVDPPGAPDGTVDLNDLLLVLSNFANTCP